MIGDLVPEVTQLHKVIWPSFVT